MLKLFKSFTPQTILLLLLFATVIKFGFLLHPMEVYTHKDEWGFNWILKPFLAMGAGVFFFKILGILNLVAQSLIINRLSTEYKLFSAESFVPAAVFILISSLAPAWNILSAPMIAAWPILITINNMMRLSMTQSPRKLLYNSGLLIALAAVIYYPSVLFLIFIIWSLILQRSVTLRDILILLLGFLTPLYFIGICLFIMDFPLAKQRLGYISITQITDIIGNYKIYLSIGLMGLLLAFGTICVNQLMYKLVEATKKNWWMVIITLIISALIGFFPVGLEPSSWYLCLLPSTLIIACIWMSESNRWVKIILFWILILSIVYIQYF